jgi:hypothetical protein
MKTDWDGDELTTTKGCFNCNKFKSCHYIRTEKQKGRDFKEIMIFEDGETEYRYGCGCGSYRPPTPKEKVSFT